MPGPNVVNLSMMIGSRYFGLPGAMAALAGMLTVPLVLILLLALVYAQVASHPGVAGALRGMSAVAAGLIIATGLRLFGALKSNPLGIRICSIVSVPIRPGIIFQRLSRLGLYHARSVTRTGGPLWTCAACQSASRNACR